MTENTTANRSAFDAYNILYYPVITAIDNASVTPTASDYAMALTVQANLDGTPYTLSESAIASLAGAYAYIRVNNEEIIIDPAADIRSFCSDTALGRPMYPDFPTQVINMDEDEYRSNQIKHYMSTYGVEFFASLLFGLDVQVKEGWLPDVKTTEKTRSDEKLIVDHVVDIVVSPQAMASIVSDEIARPRRMSAPAIELVCDLFADGYLPDTTSIAFHENMMEVIRIASERSSAELAKVCAEVAQHPGDVLKAVLWCAEKSGENHISTKAKKGFCRALENFDSENIAQNIADFSRKGEKAVNMLSVSRFAGDTLKEGIMQVLTGTVRSYASVLESKWEDYKIGIDKDGSVLLSWYGKRPGILLRSLARLLREGIDEQAVEAELVVHIDDYSLATLIQLENAATAYEMHRQKNWSGHVENVLDIKRRMENFEVNEKIAPMIARLIFDRMSKMDVPLAGKKVYVDSCGFSLAGSVILPNEVGNTSGAYPPAGMAYDVPSDKTVRFFTFWNNESERVDVDLHFKYTDTEGRDGEVGWYSSYRSRGMVTSGDITHSTNAAEYLDIDMAEALCEGIDTVYQHDHIYSGVPNWKDIETCFSGAMIVGDTDPDVELYNSENVLFHDDMTGDGNAMDYAMVDIPNHFVRILRGTSMPFTRNAFTLDAYIELLLDAQNATVVDDIEQADMVLSVGRATAGDIDGRPVVSLIDEGFFIR